MRTGILLAAFLMIAQLHGAIKKEFSSFGNYRNVRIIKVTWRGIHFTHSAGGGVFRPEDLNENEKEILAKELEIWQQKLIKHNKYQKKVAIQLKHEKEEELKDFIEKISTISFEQLNRWFEQKINVGLYDNGFRDVFERTYSVADNYPEALKELNRAQGNFEDILLKRIWKSCKGKSIEETANILNQQAGLDITDYVFKQTFYNRFFRAELRNDFFNYLEARVFNEASNAVIDSLNKAIKKGNVEAMAKYASLYASGSGVRKDLPNAVEWYKLAAKNGSIEALYALGVLSAEGAVVENSAKDSINLLLKAAEHKHQKALFALGNCYLKGFGVDKDYAKAVEYYTLAANEEYAPAQWALGICYLWGIGVQENKKNNAVAFEYFQKAAENRYVPAELVLGYWLNLNGECAKGNELLCRVYQHDFTITDFFKALGMATSKKSVRQGEFLKIGVQKDNIFALFLMKLYLATDFGAGRQIDETIDWLQKDVESVCWLSFL